MIKQFNWLGAMVILIASFMACKPAQNDATEAVLSVKFAFDANQERLNNLGQASVVPAGNAAQTPTFQSMSVHYIELTPDALTPLGKGYIAYKAEETTKGGETAVDFDKALKAGPDEVFAKISIKDIPPGTYEWIRASVTWQSYDVKFNINNVPVIGNLSDQEARVSSFLGFNTYITTVKLREKTLTVNDDKKQGFWAFETSLSSPYQAYNNLYSGSAPAGATTVVNPIFANSPVPAGSCVVTGKFDQPLVITGDEAADKTITLSFSINKSFEWKDANGNGKLDLYADGVTPNEQVVDMGLRGLIGKVSQ